MLKIGFIIILILFLSGVIAAQEHVHLTDKVAVKGKVIHADTQKEIVGATLTISFLSEHHISGKTGNFNFLVLPGNYDLEVIHNGFKTIIKKLEITEKGLTDLIISLEPEE